MFFLNKHQGFGTKKGGSESNGVASEGFDGPKPSNIFNKKPALDLFEFYFKNSQ